MIELPFVSEFAGALFPRQAFRLALFVVCALVFSGTARAEEATSNSDFRVTVEKKPEVKRADIDKGTDGKGQKRTEKLTFVASVQYSGLDDAKGIDIVLYIVGVTNVWHSSNRKLLVMGRYAHVLQDFKPGEEKNYTVGPVEFTEWSTATSSALWRGGMKYEGWVVEITKEGKLLARAGKTPDLVKQMEKKAIEDSPDGVR